MKSPERAAYFNQMPKRLVKITCEDMRALNGRLKKTSYTLSGF
jgi:hypothetical protein